MLVKLENIFNDLKTIFDIQKIIDAIKDNFQTIKIIAIILLVIIIVLKVIK